MKELMKKMNESTKKVATLLAVPSDNKSLHIRGDDLLVSYAESVEPTSF